MNVVTLGKALVLLAIFALPLVLVPSQVFAHNEMVVTPESGKAGSKINVRGRDLFLENVFVYFDTNNNGKFDDGEPKAEREPSWITGDWRATLRTPRKIQSGVYTIYAEYSYARDDGIDIETYKADFTVRKP